MKQSIIFSLLLVNLSGYAMNMDNFEALHQKLHNETLTMVAKGCFISPTRKPFYDRQCAGKFAELILSGFPVCHSLTILMLANADNYPRTTTVFVAGRIKCVDDQNNSPNLENLSFFIKIMNNARANTPKRHKIISAFAPEEDNSDNAGE